MPNTGKRSLYIVAVVLAALGFYVYAVFHAGNASALAGHMLDIAHGHPYWRAFQDRLIGPWTIRLLSGVLQDDEKAFLIFAAIGIVAANVTAAWLSTRYLTEQYQAAVALSLLGFSYVLLFDYWTYPWDFFEVVTFLLFAYLAVERKSLRYILPLFAICVLNRESCLIIGAWYGIYAITAKIISRDRRLNDGQLLLGVALIAIGAIYTILSRNLLFISSPVEGVTLPIKSSAITLCCSRISKSARSQS